MFPGIDFLKFTDVIAGQALPGINSYFQWFAGFTLLAGQITGISLKEIDSSKNVLKLLDPLQENSAAPFGGLAWSNSWPRRPQDRSSMSGSEVQELLCDAPGPLRDFPESLEESSAPYFLSSSWLLSPQERLPARNWFSELIRTYPYPPLSEINFQN